MPAPKNPPDIRTLIGQTLERTFTIERSVIDDDGKVDLSFSSEYPAERWFGLEILDHSPEACDLTRLNNGGAVLVCHDRYDQVGVVVRGTARIEKKRGRAGVKFSQSVRGQEIKQDVVDDIRTTVSFRYVIREMILESSKDGVDVYRVTKWEPLEISFEPIPADPTVGTDRSAESELLRNLSAEEKRAALQKLAEREGFKLILNSEVEIQSRTNSETPSAEPPPAPAIDPPTPERTSMPEQVTPATPPVNADLARVDDILALGEKVGLREFALDLSLEDGMTYEGARTKIAAERKRLQGTNQPATESAEDIAARNQQQPARVVSQVRVKNFENATEAYRFGKFLQAARGSKDAQRYCKENGLALERAHSENDNVSGGIFVPVEFSERLILLREKQGIVRQFGYTENMTSATKVVHRQKGGLTAYPAAAKGTGRKVAESQMSFDGIELIARKWKVTTKLEDEFSDDSTVSIADKFAGESAYAFAKAEDNAFFNADGTSAYHGLVGLRTRLRKVHNTIANIKGLTVASGNLFSEFVMGDFTKLVGNLPDYADNDNTAWYCHRYFFWNVLVPLMLAAGGTTVQQIEDAPIKKFLSYPVRLVQSFPRTDANSQIPILLGDVSLSSTFGDRLGIQVRQADQNDDDWDNDLLSMKAIERFDINHHDVGDTSEAGPVVGLISAAS